MDFPIKNISDLENISHAVKWQYFEKLIGFVFEQNEFRVQMGKVMKFGDIKRQYDVIADKFDKIFIIDCKKWSHKQRISGIKTAAQKHIERCSYLKSDTKKIIPVLITLYDDDINITENVYVVPILKLNWFINNFDNLEETNETE